MCVCLRVCTTRVRVVFPSLCAAQSLSLLMCCCVFIDAVLFCVPTPTSCSFWFMTCLVVAVQMAARTQHVDSCFHRLGIIARGPGRAGAQSTLLSLSTAQATGRPAHGHLCSRLAGCFCVSPSHGFSVF